MSMSYPYLRSDARNSASATLREDRWPLRILFNGLKLDDGPPQHQLAGNFQHAKNLAWALGKRPEVLLKVLCDERTMPLLGEHLSAEQLVYRPLRDGRVLSADMAVIRAIHHLAPEVYHRPTGQLPLGPVGVRSVATIADLNFLNVPMGFVKMLYKWISYRLTVWRADQITCVSEHTRKEVLARLHADPRKVTVIYHGANSFPAATHGLAKKAGPAYWVAFGHQVHKNVELVLRALARRPNSERLVIIGQSRHMDEVVRPLAHALGLDARVDFPGRVEASELHGLLACSLALVFPSRYEGFGLPVLEAMQVGCPVISSPVCSLPEVAGEAADYAGPDDLPGLVAAMDRLVSDAPRRMRMIGAGRLRAAEFTWEKAAEQTISVYRRSLAGCAPLR
jgi:glycosyltransferase involved in cell wall biosynthesis